MRRQKIVFALSLLLSWNFAQAEAKFDISTLNKKTPPPEAAKKANSTPSDPKQNKMKIDLTLQEDPKKLETQIKALNLIIKTEKNRVKKIQLYLQKSYLHVSVAKMLGLNRVKKNELTAAEKFHLDEARKILTFLLKNIRNDKIALASIYNVMGLVEYETDNPEKTVEYFKKAIELDSKNPQAETMCIYIAEYFFDLDKYEEAIKYYYLLYSQMTPYQKALSDYKVAWAYINLKDYEKAEKNFVKIIKENFDKGVVEDSYKDLAFIITRDLDEAAVLQKSRLAFTDAALRAKFLYYCLLFYLQQSKNNPREILFTEILQIQSDPYERIKILALKVSFERKDYPTTEVYKALVAVNDFMKTIDVKIKQKYLTQDSHQLEEDSEVVIRQYVDAYTGKLKTQENLEKTVLAKSMIQLISIHLDWFPQTENFVVLYNLWIDSCVDLKNSECLFGLERDLQPKLKDRAEVPIIHQRVKLEILALYDQAYTTNPNKHEAAFLFRLKEYASLFPNDANSLRIQKRIFGIYAKNKNFNEALHVADQLYVREPTAENLQKVWYSLFELGKYSDILESQEIKKVSSPELFEIRRESSLKSAQLSADKGDFEKYESNVKIYLQSSPPPDKAILVYVDLFIRLIDLKKWDQFVKEWTELTEAWKSKKEFYPVRKKAHDYMAMNGVFVRLPGFWENLGDADLRFQVMLEKRALNQPLSADDFAQIKQLPEAQKKYLYNLLALSQSKILKEILLAQKSLTESDRKLLLLCVYLEKKDSQFILSPKEMTLLKDLVPEKHWPDSITKIEKDLATLVFPTPQTSANRYNKMVEGLVNDVKYLRGRGVKSLKTLLKAQKIRVLTQMISNETRMADAIKNSPPPNGLNPTQIDEYKKGLAEVALEYEQQAEEFKKAKLELEGLALRENENILELSLPEINIEKWDLSSSPAKDMALKQLSGGFAAGALITVDQYFANKQISETDYYRLRAGLLVRLSNSEAMRRVIREEWVAAKQEALIESWKGLAK